MALILQDTQITARAAASGRLSHQRCSVEGCLCRIDFSRADSALIFSSGSATSINFFVVILFSCCLYLVLNISTWFNLFCFSKCSHNCSHNYSCISWVNSWVSSCGRHYQSFGLSQNIMCIVSFTGHLNQLSVNQPV